MNDALEKEIRQKVPITGRTFSELRLLRSISLSNKSRASETLLRI